MTALHERATRRFYARHPALLILTVMGVSVGVAVVVAIDLAIETSRSSFRQSTETLAGRATHQVVGGVTGLPDSTFFDVRVRAGVRESAPAVEGYVTALGLPQRPLRLLGVDPLAEATFRSFAGGEGGTQGALSVGGDGVVLSSVLAAALGVSPGDSFPVSVEGRPRILRVEGTFSLREETAARAARDLILADVSLAQSLLRRPGRLDRIDLRLPEGAEGEAALARLAALLPADAVVSEVGARAGSLAQMIEAFDLNLTALSLLALVFGMFLIYNAMTFAIVQRRDLIGTLRAMGVTRREIGISVVKEGLAIGILGALLGALLGIVVGRGLLRLVVRTINDLYTVLAVDALAVEPLVLIKAVGVGVAVTVLATLPPAWEAVSAPPRIAIERSFVETRARGAVRWAWSGGLLLILTGAVVLAVPTTSIALGFAGLFFILLGMALLAPSSAAALSAFLAPALTKAVGAVGAMAARGVRTSLSRTAPAVAALVVAVGVTVGLGVMISSFRHTVVRWLEGTLQADLYVSAPALGASRPGGTLSPDVVGALTEAPDVRSYSTYRGVTVARAEGPLRLVALSLAAPGEAAFDFQESASDPFDRFRRRAEVFVSEPYAFRNAVGVGDSVSLPTAEGAVSLPIAAVFFDYGSDQGVVMLDRAIYDRYWVDPGITSLGLFLRPGLDADVVGERLQALLPEGRQVLIRSNRGLREASLEVFDRTFAVTAVLRLLAFGVAFIGVLGALMALELDRVREHGLLRAMGMTPAGIGGLVATETGLLGLISGLLAIPVGVVLAWVMVFVINKRSFGWTLQMHIGPTVVLQALVLALAGALLAGVYPAWRMARTPPAVALRGE